MLDEFSTSDCCPFVEPYLDYRVIRLNRCMIIELAALDRGASLGDMTKFEKAIVFKDIREHLLKILMTLAYLKARFVKNSEWLRDDNIRFDMDTFEPKINNFVVIDVLGTQQYFLSDNDIDLADIGGESQLEQINGDFYSLGNSAKGRLIARGDSLAGDEKIRKKAISIYVFELGFE